jgi:CDP-diacylglycerol--glycerol-3-phosphate 3-phosphatidyltransferase
VTIYSFKPKFQGLLRPGVVALARAGVTANQVTVAAALGSVLVGAFVFAESPTRWPFLLLPAWLFIRMALNAVDGMLAREFGQKSVLGAYLNELSDVVSDAALYLPFAVLPPFGPLWVGAAILLAALTEFAGALGQTVGASRRYDGPLGKSDRAFVFGALGFYAGLGGPLPGWSWWLMPIAAIVLAATVVNRVRAGIAEVGGARRR